MDKLIYEKLDNDEKEIFIQKEKNTITIDDNEFVDNRTIDKLIIDIALKYEHYIKSNKNIIINNYVINPIPDRQEIWDSFTNEHRCLCPCCIYHYITIFTFCVRYKWNIEKEHYLEDLLPLCKMCYTLLGDQSYKVFKKEYDRRYKEELLRVGTE